MTVRAGACAVVVALAAAAPAAAMPMGDAGTATDEVSIGFAAYAPMHLEALVGDTVHWSNDSVRAHTVTADDGTFDSGRLPPGDHYQRVVVTPGTIAYHCTLHAGIIGAIDVRRLLLAPPAGAASPGRPFPLRGRVALPAGTPVRIQADSGSGFADVGPADVDAGGTLTALVHPTTSATYRAVAGDATSNPVQVLVLDRAIALAARRAHGRDVLTVQVTPPSPGAHVVLQLRIPERFGWWPVQLARLDAASRARFTVRTRRRLAARVHLTLADDATTLAESRVVHVGPVGRR